MFTLHSGQMGTSDSSMFSPFKRCVHTPLRSDGNNFTRGTIFVPIFRSHSTQVRWERYALNRFASSKIAFTLHSGQMGTNETTITSPVAVSFTLHSGQMGTYTEHSRKQTASIVHTPLRSDGNLASQMAEALGMSSSHSTQVRWELSSSNNSRTGLVRSHSTQVRWEPQ